MISLQLRDPVFVDWASFVNVPKCFVDMSTCFWNLGAGQFEGMTLHQYQTLFFSLVEQLDSISREFVVKMSYR